MNVNTINTIMGQIRELTNAAAGGNPLLAHRMLAIRTLLEREAASVDALRNALANISLTRNDHSTPDANKVQYMALTAHNALDTPPGGDGGMHEAMVKLSCALGSPKTIDAAEGQGIDAALIEMAADRLGAQQAWRGLTKEEIDHEVSELVALGTEFVAPLYSAVESIERKLMERNAGRVISVTVAGDSITNQHGHFTSGPGGFTPEQSAALMRGEIRGLKLAEEQRQALGEALTSKLSDMQGGDAGPDWFDARIMDEVLDVIEQTLGGAHG